MSDVRYSWFEEMREIEDSALIDAFTPEKILKTVEWRHANDAVCYITDRGRRHGKLALADKFMQQRGYRLVEKHPYVRFYADKTPNHVYWLPWLIYAIIFGSVIAIGLVIR
jgi:hypothetical protein